jgi:hypothetical protein
MFLSKKRFEFDWSRCPTSVAFSAGGDGVSGLLEQIKRSLTTPLGRP